MTVFSGMEAIDTKEDIEQEVIQEDITPILFDLIDDENSLAEDLLDIDQMLIAEDKFNTAFEQLEALRDSIEEFGLSKGVIKAVDPDGYLEANGIVPAYEELNDLPTKDEKLEIALESIGESIGKAWEKIKKFIMFLWNTMKNIFKKFMHLFDKKKKILDQNKKKIKKLKEFDEEKIKTKKIKTISLNNLLAAFEFYNNDLFYFYDNIMEYVVNFLDDIDTSDMNSEKNNAISSNSELLKKLNDMETKENVTKYLGLDFNINIFNGNFSIRESKYGYIFDTMKEDTMKNHGYDNPSKITLINNAALDYTNNAKSTYEKTIKNMEKSKNDIIKEGDKIIKSGDEAEAKNIKENLDYAKTVFNFVIKILKNGLVNSNKAVSEVMHICNESVSLEK